MYNSNLAQNEINGFIVIDKPKGPTSHQVDAWVREITGEKRVGHVGTLDPNVSGVLVMALGKATKLIDIVHEKPKEYISVMRLYSQADQDVIIKTFKEFTGKIYQLPPVRSAVSRQIRERTIYSMDILEINDKLILFKVKCESGTYIRTLCTDMGYVIGTGAQMADLRRLYTGDFNESKMHTLQELSDSIVLKKQGDSSMFDSMLIPMDFVFADTPKVVVKNTAIKNIMNGSDIYPAGIKAIVGNIHKGSRVAIYTDNNELIAYGTMLVDTLNDLKAVDLDGILSDKYGQNNVVRKSNKQKNIPVQRPARKLHEHIPEPSGRNNTGNGKYMFKKNSSPERPPSKIRKGKNKF
ncbi:RNA-guided pseudouridylation complex pseudouridine synthase subunit Cbf5 [Ferroplasma sp.]|uniref:RNA-guided pseudouridylation complex pseudouridine synthase subunit Cbf5 n=1 Tax=Ferroplasma sp. TaxID=2591003 RepID=UPI00307FA6F9